MEETEETIYLDKIYVTTDNGQTYTPYKIKTSEIEWEISEGRGDE